MICISPFRHRAASLGASILAALTIISVAHPLAAYDEMLTTHVGDKLVLHLKGDPTLGLTWKLNSAQSSGIELANIDQIGWTVKRRRGWIKNFYVDGTMRYLVVPKKTGQVSLVFDYVIKYKKRKPPIRSKVYHLVIGKAEGEKRTSSNWPFP